MKTAFHIALLLLAGFTSCQKASVVDTGLPYTVHVDSLKNWVRLEDLIEECKYIQLEQGENFEYILSNIQNVFVTDQRILFLSDGVYCFDLSGHPVYKIDQKGHASSEYIDCSSVSIDDNYVYMLDRVKSNIHVYSIADGSFVRNIACPRGLYNIKKTRQGIIVDIWSRIATSFYDGEYRFIACDSDMTKCNAELLFDEDREYHHVGYVSDGNDCLLFSDNYYCNLYKVTDQGADLYLKIDCSPSQRLPQSVKEKLVEGRNYALGQPYVRNLHRVYETVSHIVGSIDTPQGGIFFVYDKESRKARRAESSLKKYMFPPIISASNDNYFVQILDSETIDVYTNPEMPDTLLAPTHPDYAIQQVYKQHKEDQNPIIVLYKFKKGL